MQAAGLTHVSPGNRLASAGGLVPRPRACPNPQYLLSKARVVKLRASKNIDEDKINVSEEAFKELIIKAQAMAAKEKEEDARESEMMLKEWN
jgi:hypothetical protein